RSFVAPRRWATGGQVRRVTSQKPCNSRENPTLRSGREDLNLRPHGPEPCALPDCATPRDAVLLDVSREKRGGAAWSPGEAKSRSYTPLARLTSETSSGTAWKRSATRP